MRHISRLLEINDINLDRIQQEIAIYRDRCPNENEKKIQTLTTRLESGDVTPLAYVKAIGHLKSKIQYGEDMDSDSDSEVEEEEAPEEVPAAEPQVETSQEDAMTCKVCWVRPIDTVVLQCRHSGCNTCLE